MKKVKPNYYKEIIEVLQDLHKSYPSYSLGKHLATATDDYGDMWGMSDKELSFALTKYRAQMEMDVPRETDEKEIQKIIQDGMNLKSVYFEDEENE